MNGCRIDRYQSQTRGQYGAGGYVLLVVSVALLMIATAALSLFANAGQQLTRLQAEQAQFELSAGLQAGLAHNLRVLHNNSACSGYTTANASLGNVSYSGAINSTSSSPVLLTVTASHADGQSEQSSRVISMYSGLNSLSLNATADAYLKEDQPDRNEGNSGDLHTRITTDGRNEHALLLFDLGAVPETAYIESAELAVWLRSNGNDSAVPSAVHRLTRAWTEADVSWTRATGGFFGFWLVPGGEFENAPFAQMADSALDLQTVDISRLARLWQGGVANHGVLLRGDDSAGDAHVNYESREDTDGAKHPRLNIDYRCDCLIGCV